MPVTYDDNETHIKKHKIICIFLHKNNNHRFLHLDIVFDEWNYGHFYLNFGDLKTPDVKEKDMLEYILFFQNLNISKI